MNIFINLILTVMKTIVKIVKKAGSWIVQTLNKPAYYTPTGIIPMVRV